MLAELSLLSFLGGVGSAAAGGAFSTVTTDTISAVTLLSSEAALTTSYPPGKRVSGAIASFLSSSLTSATDVRRSTGSVHLSRSCLTQEPSRAPVCCRV